MVVAIPKWMHFSKTTSAPRWMRMNDISGAERIEDSRSAWLDNGMETLITTTKKLIKQ
jgi:hypothetical protein